MEAWDSLSQVEKDLIFMEVMLKVIDNQDPCKFTGSDPLSKLAMLKDMIQVWVKELEESKTTVED